MKVYTVLLFIMILMFTSCDIFLGTATVVIENNIEYNVTITIQGIKKLVLPGNEETWSVSFSIGEQVLIHGEYFDNVSITTSFSCKESLKDGKTFRADIDHLEACAVGINFF